MLLKGALSPLICFSQEKTFRGNVLAKLSKQNVQLVVNLRFALHFDQRRGLCAFLSGHDAYECLKIA